MNWASVALWGFVGSLLLTTLMAGAQGFGITRINLPFMLGTAFTPDRDRAKIVGVFFQLLNGWVIAGLYALIFESLRTGTWWLGTIMGLIHGLIVLFVLMPLLPSIHPRMASEQRGPTPTKQLEPPGFMGLHYGRRTPISILVAHAAYGLIQGAFYRLN